MKTTAKRLLAVSTLLLTLGSEGGLRTLAGQSPTGRSPVVSDDDSLAKLPPPAIQVKVAPIRGAGDDRESSYQITNRSGKKMVRFEVEFLFLKADDSIGKRVPSTHVVQIDAGETRGFEIGSFFMEDDTASVDVVVKDIVYDDQSTWPAAPREPAARNGDDPVSAKMMGLVGEDDRLMPATAVHNYSDRFIKSVTCVVEYFDEDGERLGHANQLYYRGESGTLAPGKTAVATGGQGPPEGAVVARSHAIFVTFADGSEWRREK